MAYTMCMKLQNEATSTSGRGKVTPMRRLPAKPRTSSALLEDAASAPRRTGRARGNGTPTANSATPLAPAGSGVGAAAAASAGGCGGPPPLRLPTGNPSQNPDAPGEPNAPLPTKPALCPPYGDLHSWARLASPNQGSPGEPSLGSESIPRDSKNLNHGVLEIQKPPCEKHDPFVNKYSPCCGPLGAPAWR